MNDIVMRVELLRGEMMKNDIDFYVILSSDYHDSEYVDDYFKEREDSQQNESFDSPNSSTSGSGSEDLGNYYRIPADNRDLNYERYESKGNAKLDKVEEYNSHNTNRLDVDGTVEKILTTDYVQEELKKWKGEHK